MADNVSIVQIKSVYITDHNQAFSREFDDSRFRARHIFRDEFAGWSTALSDRVLREFAVAVAVANAAIAEVPDEWLFLDEGQTLASGFSADWVRECLARARDAAAFQGSDWP
jgi:hypothetical protein